MGKRIPALLLVLIFTVLGIAGCNQTSEPEYKVQIRELIKSYNDVLSNDEKLIKHFTNYINSFEIERPFGILTKEEEIISFERKLNTYKEQIGITDIKELKIDLTIEEISDLYHNKDKIIENKFYYYACAYVIWKYTLNDKTTNQMVAIEFRINYNQENKYNVLSINLSYNYFLPDYSKYIKN